MMPAVAPHLRSIVDDDGAVILDVPTNTMTTLNPIGAYIWQQLERGTALSSIVKDLARETDTSETLIAADLDAFLDELKSRHLLAVPKLQ